MISKVPLAFNNSQTVSHVTLPLEHFLFFELFQLLNVLNGLVGKDKFRPVSLWFKIFSSVLFGKKVMDTGKHLSVVAKPQVDSISGNVKHATLLHRTAPQCSSKLI